MASDHEKERGNWERLTRVERLGEMLVRRQVLKLSELTELIEEQHLTPYKKLGELAVEKGFISQAELMTFLMAQFKESQAVDESLRGVEAGRERRRDIGQGRRHFLRARHLGVRQGA